MIGKPKYKIGDEVKFVLTDENGDCSLLHGTISIVDAYGVFEDNSKVYYDIQASEWNGQPCNILYKHVREDIVSLKN